MFTGLPLLVSGTGPGAPITSSPRSHLGGRRQDLEATLYGLGEVPEPSPSLHFLTYKQCQGPTRQHALGKQIKLSPQGLDTIRA